MNNRCDCGYYYDMEEYEYCPECEQKSPYYKEVSEEPYETYSHTELTDLDKLTIDRRQLESKSRRIRLENKIKKILHS